MVIFVLFIIQESKSIRHILSGAQPAGSMRKHKFSEDEDQDLALFRTEEWQPVCSREREEREECEELIRMRQY